MINVLYTAINYKNGLLEATVDFDSICKNFSLFVYMVGPCWASG